nr:META domain-containing protein [uncultured Sphingomonas sp.]
MRVLACAAAAAALLSACATVPMAPAEPAATYRALGTEPFWSLELNGRDMVFTEANAPGQRIVDAQPRPIHGFAGDIYQGRRINLNIVRGQRCSDGMSDRVYPDRVQVRVDGRSFEGCGGEGMMPVQLEGTSWSVESVNGRAAPDGERYFVRFEGGQLRARFGCNSLSTPVQQDGTRLVTGALVATRMACPDMRDETEASQVLRQPGDLSWGAGDRLTISNSGGRIVLRRVI